MCRTSTLLFTPILKLFGIQGMWFGYENKKLNSTATNTFGVCVTCKARDPFDGLHAFFILKLLVALVRPLRVAD